MKFYCCLESQNMKVEFQERFNLYVHTNFPFRKNCSSTSLIHRRCSFTKIRIITRNRATTTAVAEEEAKAESSPVGPQNLVTGLRAVFYVSVRFVRSAGYTYFYAHERGKL